MKEHTHHLDADLRNVYVRLAGRYRVTETDRAKSLHAEKSPVMM